MGFLDLRRGSFENTQEMAEKAGRHWPSNAFYNPAPSQPRPHVDRRRHLLGSLLVRHLQPTAMAPNHNPQRLHSSNNSLLNATPKRICDGYNYWTTRDYIPPQNGEMGMYVCVCGCIIYIYTHIGTIIDHKANIIWGSQFRQRVLTRQIPPFFQPDSPVFTTSMNHQLSMISKTSPNSLPLPTTHKVVAL